MTDGPRRRPRTTGSGRAAPPSAARRAPAARAGSSKAAPTKKAAPGKRATARKAAPRKPAASNTAASRKTKPIAARKAAPASAGARRTGRPAPRPGRRIAAGLVVSVVMVGFLLIGVFPTRTWLAQREETRERQAELDRIRAEQAVQEDRIAELEDPDVIEQIARDQFGRVRPGEEAYRVFPPGAPPVDLPETWPFIGADDWLNR